MRIPGHAPAVRAALALVVALVAASCSPTDNTRFAPDVERQLDAARAFGDELVAESARSPTPEEAIAVGYLERHRLGLGSPFRLIEYSLMDPRLEKVDREKVAWALLAATVDGAGHRVDPRTLGSDGDVRAAVRHLELIEGAIQESPQPDGGVLAVRLAYAMAGAESSVPPRMPNRVAQAAALIRDRAVAQDDARRLLRAAGSRHDPLSLVTVWRVERRFQVEAPTVLPVASDVEQDAIALAPRLLDGIRSIADRPRVGPLIPPPETRQRPLLSAAAARLLATQSADFGAPPQTPVTVAVEAHRSDPGALDSSDAEALDRFFANAVNDERVAAEYALLHHRDAVHRRARLGLISAAVALRGYAQERPWFPGFAGPAERDLEERFGLADVSFPEDVPAAWRPYYRRMLESALSDLQRVLPALDVRGLKVRFERREGSSGTLAIHDPRTRTIFVPPATGAGTFAHEIAHDLDWQTALRRYRVRGDYATDRALRLSDSRMTRVLQGLTTTASPPPVAGNEAFRSHSTRPAEIFARSVDWFVAVALARDGRINGYLSSVQDDLLTGYGTVTAPDVSGTAGQSLMTLLDEVAPVYPETRRWFLESYGRSRAPTAYDLARRVLETPLRVEGEAVKPEVVVHPPGPAVDTLIGGDAEASGDSTLVQPQPDSLAAPLPVLARLAVLDARLDQLEVARDSVLGMAGQGCNTVGYADRAGPSRVQLVSMLVNARARGLALTTAEEVAGRDGRQWMLDRLRGRNDGVDLPLAVAAALRPVVERVGAVGDVRLESEPLAMPVPAADCTNLPFGSY